MQEAQESQGYPGQKWFGWEADLIPSGHTGMANPRVGSAGVIHPGHYARQGRANLVVGSASAINPGHGARQLEGIHHGMAGLWERG